MQKVKQITIAVDGFSSCGKSTLAKALAKKLDYIFVDSGAMYRGVTLYCMRNGLLKNGEPVQDLIEQQLDGIELDFRMNPKIERADLYLNDENVEDLIRDPSVAENVSKIASIKAVRQKLVQAQQKMGQNGGIIMDGRDIGSVVFPHAELKLFITADPEIRAKRRYNELTSKGIDTSFEEVYRNLTERDQLDSSRKESPLIKTADAIEIDTTDLTPEGQLDLAFQYALKIIN